MDDAKSILASKTFWINLITIAIAIITSVTGADVLPAEYVAYATSIVLPVLNIVLRAFTDKPVEMRLPKKP